MFKEMVEWEKLKEEKCYIYISISTLYKRVEVEKNFNLILLFYYNFFLSRFSGNFVIHIVLVFMTIFTLYEIEVTFFFFNFLSLCYNFSKNLKFSLQN